ncbi:TolC family outer membrane protein [Terasakiella sp. A23]|uniref:TolC family outer membrane protein n=1 Tax=Terasakiella sp. FCG-A23 TaxID=3080561 RepID=UPI002954D8B4|nr:TolC family outer membrane protein [Terasakiella sp. A23]MDV7338744.1 TolC family outer membrane protein [Terasakiella sp. A23]
MVASVSSQSKGASLETELSQMLLEHPQLQAAQKTTLGADREIDVQSAANLPTVSLNADYGYEHISTPTTRSDAGKSSTGKMRQVAGVTVTQNLFDGYAKTSAVRTARLNKAATESTELVTEQNLILEGITAYLNVLKQSRRIKHARENEANIKKQMELENERVRRGSGIGIDVLNAKSRLQTAIEKRVEYEGELSKATDQYIQVFGHAPDLAAMIAPAPPLDILPLSLDDAIEQSIRNNPNIHKAEFDAESAAENKRTVRAEYYPTVDLTGTMNYEDHKNGVDGKRRDYSVLVEAEWDLFSGFSTEYSMKKAVYNYAASKDTHSYVSRKMVEATRIAWHDLETIEERLSLVENDVILKDEIFLSTQKQRENGAEGVDVLNVLDREKEVYEAKIKYAELFFDHKRAIYSVMLATGQLSADTLALQ